MWIIGEPPVNYRRMIGEHLLVRWITYEQSPKHLYKLHANYPWIIGDLKGEPTSELPVNHWWTIGE